MRRLITLPAGRRAKWLYALGWLVIALIAGSFASEFQGAQRNDPSSYLPGSAESSKALAQSKTITGGDEITNTIVVYHRGSGLQSSDLAAIEADRAKLNAELPPATMPSPPAVRSRDGSAALLNFGLRLHGDSKQLNDQVGLIREVAHSGPAGLEAKVTGPGGISYDGGKVFGSINGTLLYTTVLLVFVLLILIYRSPIFWIIPLAAVGFAEVVSEGLGYALTQAGVTVNGQSAGVLTVLVFGAGTDYALLLVARYREELRRHEDRHEAMRAALRRAGPVMLVIAGRRAFWPFIPRVGSEGADAEHGLWRRIAEFVERRHRAIAPVAVLGLLVLCLGLLDYDTNLTNGNEFRGEVESQQGQTLLAEHYPAGASAPVQVVVPELSRVPAVRAAVAAAPGVAQGPGALGFGSFMFKEVFGYPGESPVLLLFAFIFLVALGVDYTIFLMARVREETLHVGTREGVVRGLAVTGAVITSAGIVLAGTFAALASLPLVSFTEIGFTIAFGVLLDTFLVRTVLVPSLVIELDRRVWWPSALARAGATERVRQNVR